MSDETRDKAEGMVDEGKGRVKSAAGELTGDNKTKAEGELDQIVGKVKQGAADLKDKAEDAIDKMRDNGQKDGDR